MTWLQVLFSAVAVIILFLFSLQSFSHELQTVGGETLKAWLGRATANRWKGLLAGAAATALVQSSSAVSALAVALVDAGVISFKASLGVLLGASIGTTSTAWLVSFKLTTMGPYFIVLGALVSLLPFRYSFLGKAIFYFGVIFFALNLVSDRLKPLSEVPAFREWLGRAEAPWLGVLVGIVFTALVQSIDHWAVHPSGAAGHTAGSGGDSHCGGGRHRHNFHRAHRQLGNEAGSPGHRGGQSVLQRSRCADLPSVPAAFLPSDGGLVWSRRHVGGVGAVDFQRDGWTSFHSSAG